MNNLFLPALICAASFVLPAAALAQDVKPPEVNISGVYSAQDESQIATQMSASEFAKFSRTYELSNGTTLSLFNRSNMKFAKLGDGKWHNIVATGSNSFRSRDHQLKMQINLHDDDSVSGYLLMPAESPAVAGNDVDRSGFVQVAFQASKGH